MRFFFAPAKCSPFAEVWICPPATGIGGDLYGQETQKFRAPFLQRGILDHLAEVKALSIGSNLAVSTSNWEGVTGCNVLQKSFVVEQKKVYGWCQYVLITKYVEIPISST